MYLLKLLEKFFEPNHVNLAQRLIRSSLVVGPWDISLFTNKLLIGTAACCALRWLSVIFVDAGAVSPQLQAIRSARLAKIPQYLYCMTLLCTYCISCTLLYCISTVLHYSPRDLQYH